MDLDDAKKRIRLSYDMARKVGSSMSPVWLEEWETSVIGASEQVVFLEIHNAKVGIQSHFQLVFPGPNHELSWDDTGEAPPVPSLIQLHTLMTCIFRTLYIHCTNSNSNWQLLS